ncbi:hypothetical protein ACHAXM_008638 [Skeletonema potamos]
MMLDGAGIFMEIIFLKNSSNLTSSHQTMNKDMRNKHADLGKGKEVIMNVYKPLFGEVVFPKFNEYGVYQ